MATDLTIVGGYFGRRKLWSAEASVTEANLLSILAATLPDHVQNAEEIDYLWKYWRGVQPILGRTKDIRPEINNKIVENHAQEAVSFFSGYFLGEPVAYVRRGVADTAAEIDELNSLMLSANKAPLDKELATWMFIGGVGYRICLPGRYDDPLDIDVLDPRDTFVVYSTDIGRRPLLAGMVRVDNKGKVSYVGYTRTHYFEVSTSAVRQTVGYTDIAATSPYAPLPNGEIVKFESHGLGRIPIIEYDANAAMMGAFEPGIGIMDAINTVASNRVDGIEQFIQSIMVLTDADIDEDGMKSAKNWGLVKLRSVDQKTPTLQLLSESLDQMQTQTLVDYMKDTLKEIIGMPHSAKGMSGGTSGNVGSVIMWQGWETCEARMKDTELLFVKSEREFLKLALSILRNMGGPVLEEASIDIKFVRRQYDAIITKVQALQGMLQAGLAPEIAISTCGLFNDPVDVTNRSAEYLEKWKVTTNVVQGSAGDIGENPSSRGDRGDQAGGQGEEGNGGTNQPQGSTP